MPARVWITLPALAQRRRTRTLMRWLKFPGQRIAPREPLARLDSDVTLCAPEACSGVLEKHLVGEGALVIVGEPLARITDAGMRGLAETSASYDDTDGAPRLLVAQIARIRHMSTLAIVGAVALIGLASAVAAALAYLLIGGIVPPLLAALFLAITAGALSYGEYHLDRSGAQSD